jgi:hypothetical protein
VKTNKLWHAANRMPVNAKAEQRIEWHLEHFKRCGCRPIPNSVVTLMRARGIPIPERPLRRMS